MIVGEVTTDVNGAFSTSFQIPYNFFSGDRNMVGAIDATGFRGASVIHVVLPPEIELPTASGAFGAAIAISGVGFLPNARPSALSLFGTNFLPDSAFFCVPITRGPSRLMSGYHSCQPEQDSYH